MSDPTRKPWTLIDEDETDLIASAPVAASRHVTVADHDGDESEASDGAIQSPRWLRNLTLSPYWSLWAFGPAVLYGSWTLFKASGSGGLSRGAAYGVIMLCGAGVAMLVAARINRRRVVSRMLRAIHQGVPSTAASAPKAVDSDLRPVWDAVIEHTGNIERRVNELANSQRASMLELTLAGAQRRLSADIFNSLPDALMALDSFGQVIQANRSAEQLFNFSMADAARPPLTSIVTQEHLLKCARQALEADLRAAERRVEFGVAEKYYCALIEPLTRADQETSASGGHGLVVLIRDITRDRDVSRKKSEFVAHVAHELRTPLTSIRGYVEMLVDGEATDEATRKEYYDIIQTSAERLGRLIDNMLNISRIESGTVRINKEPISVSMVVKEACDMMRPSADEKKIKFVEQLTPVIFRVLADRDLIYQAVLNLISNALKYTPEGGEVTVRMMPREETRTILIEIQDTGAGIPKEDLPRMFQKFFRVEANMNMAKGTGLGLNLVKNIVEVVHGGQISLTSEVGKGSTFGIALPLMA